MLIPLAPCHAGATCPSTWRLWPHRLDSATDLLVSAARSNGLTTTTRGENLSGWFPAVLKETGIVSSQGHVRVRSLFSSGSKHTLTQSLARDRCGQHRPTKRLTLREYTAAIAVSWSAERWNCEFKHSGCNCASIEGLVVRARQRLPLVTSRLRGVPPSARCTLLRSR